MWATIVILWAVYSFFSLCPHYSKLFPLNGTSANSICEAGAKAEKPGVLGEQTTSASTEIPHFSDVNSHPSLTDDHTSVSSALLFLQRSPYFYGGKNNAPVCHRRLTDDFWDVAPACLLSILQSANFSRTLLSHWQKGVVYLSRMSPRATLLQHLYTCRKSD